MILSSNKIMYVFLSLQGFSTIGSRISAIAVGIWIVKEFGDVTPLLLISLFHELPLLLFGSWIGLAVDRWRRKTAIIAGDIGQVLCTVMLVVSVMLGNFELWFLYAIVGIQGIFAALQNSAASALIPLMADDAGLDRANSMRELLFPLASVIAPFIAGMLFEPLGITGIIMIDISTFFVCIAGVVVLRLPELNRKGEVKRDEKLVIAAIQGYRYIWNNKPLLYLFLYFALWDFILNGPLELAIPFFLKIYESDAVMSRLLGVMNAGALAGAVFAVLWGRIPRKITLIFGGSLLTALMFIGVGLSGRAWVMGTALFLLMFPLAMTGALFASILQQHTPAAMHGRIFTAYGQLTALTAPLSFLITGPVVDRWLEPAMLSGYWSHLNVLFGLEAGSGIRLLFCSCGILLMGGVLWTLSSRQVRRLGERHTINKNHV